MNIKRKILPLLLAMIAFTACNKNNDTSPEQSPEMSVAAQEAGLPAEVREVSADAAKEATPSRYFEYTIKNGEIELKKYTGSDTNVVIPDYIERCPVVKYTKNIFAGTDVTEITFPSTIKDITEIVGTDSLETINISSGTEKFTSRNFSHCTGLKNINAKKGDFFTSIDGILYSADGKTLICCPIGRTGKLAVADGTEVIGESAFFRSSLTTVTLPDGLKTIEKDAFLSSSLTDITIPSGAADIGDYAFMESALESVTLNEGLKSIGKLAFANTNVEEISLPDSIESCGLIFGSDFGKKISAPLSALYSEGMSQLYGLENVSYRDESALDIMLRKTSDLDNMWYNGRIFIDLDGDGLPEMAEPDNYYGVSWNVFNIDKNKWEYILDTPADTELSIYYDTENDNYICLYPDMKYYDDEYFYSGYRDEKFSPGENSPAFYNKVVSGSDSRYRLVNTVNIQKIIDEYGDEDKKYEIVMSDFSGTSTWRGVPVTEFPYSVKWYPDGMAITVDRKDLLNGETVEGITYKGGKLTINSLNIDGDIYISGIDKLEIELSGDSDINNLKFLGTDLTIKGDGTLSAENVTAANYHDSIKTAKSITISENAHIIGKDDPENAYKLNNTVISNSIYLKDNGCLESPMLKVDYLSLSDNACVKTLHCDGFNRIALTGNSVMEVVSDYGKYPNLEITYELRHCMYCTPQISVSDSSRLSVVCYTSFGIDCYGHTDSKVTVSDNGILEISGTSSYGLSLDTGIPGALTMNDNALVTINGSDYALTAHKIEINGGTLDIRSNQIAAYINFAASSETGLFINGDVVSQSSEWKLSQFEPGITYELAVSSAESEEVLKDFSITVKGRS